jgi:hypothetical protein
MRQRDLAAEAGPAFRNDDGVAGILRVVLYTGGETESAGMEIDELSQPGYVLRALVLHAGDVVLVDQELRRDLDFAVHFLDVDDGSVAETSFRAEPIAAFSFDLNFGLTASAQQEQDSADGNSAGANDNGIENAKTSHRRF